MEFTRLPGCNHGPPPLRHWSLRGYVARACLVNPLAAVFACLVLWGGGASSAVGSEAFKIFILGDSLTAGYGLNVEKSFPAQLEAALEARGHRVRVINGGVSGDTTAGGRARIGWALKAKPDAVLVALGGNDALRGIDPGSTRANLDAILTRLGRAGVPALLAGWKSPRNLGPEYIRDFEAVFPALARKHRVLFYPFILDGVALKPALNQGDGIHPNARGVAAMVKSMLPLVERLMARIGKESATPGFPRSTGGPGGGPR
ncbi:MAG: arylesterase [Alphaproteobacteria bacterium]